MSNHEHEPNEYVQSKQVRALFRSAFQRQLKIDLLLIEPSYIIEFRPL